MKQHFAEQLKTLPPWDPLALILRGPDGEQTLCETDKVEDIQAQNLTFVGMDADGVTPIFAY
jgi:hypothetical protein